MAPKHILGAVNDSTGGKLEEWLKAKRAEGVAWEELAYQLRGEPFHVTCTTKTLRRWWDSYIDPPLTVPAPPPPQPFKL